MNSKKILVVESDLSLAQEASKHLKAEGYQVATALGGPGILDLVCREKPDLLIMDFHTMVSQDPSLLEKCALSRKPSQFQL